MRSLKFALASLCMIGFAGAANAEPIKIRNSWVAPVTNWASILLERKELAKHMGQSYVMEPVRFAGTAETGRIVPVRIIAAGARELIGEAA